MKKRLIACVLLIAMLVTTCPRAAQAEESAPEVATSGEFGGFTWEIEDRVLTISGTGEMPVVADHAYPWRDSAYEYAILDLFDSVVISDGITSIADFAFAVCENIVQVTIPSSVKRIGENAFQGCWNLKEIDLPEGVEEIGARAFVECGPSVIRIPSTLKVVEADGLHIGSSVDLYLHSLESWVNVSMEYMYDNPMIWADNIYIGGELVTDIVIPDGVTKIGDFQFAGFGATSIRIPDSVTEIGERAFYYNSNVETIVFPASVQKIGAYNFDDGNDAGEGANPEGFPKVLILNPDCEIAEEQFYYQWGTSQRTTVYGYAGSTAQTVAEANGLDFVEIMDYEIEAESDVANPGEIMIFYVSEGVEDLDGVYINGKRLDESCYTVNEDYHEVTLVAEYLATLDEGAYELMLWFTDGVAFADFFVSGQEEVTYTVSYYLLPGGDEILESQTKTSGEALTIHADIPKMEGGWNFLGWDADGDDTTVEYLPGETYTLDADLKLGGVWEDAYVGEIGVSYEAEVPVRFPGAGADYIYTGVPTVVAFTPEAGFTYRISLPQAYSGRFMLYSNGELVGQAMSSGDCSLEFDADGSRFDVYIYGPTADFTGDIQLLIVREVLYGDVNSDGKVNAQDRLYLTRYLAGMTGYTEDMIDMTAADVNRDGVVNPKDRLILTRFLAQWTEYPSLPCEG